MAVNPFLEDPVTGMLSRMGLVATLAGQTGKWRLLLVDLIDFGTFEKYSEGDGKLGLFARALYRKLTGEHRTATLVFSRWGGDEFLVAIHPAPGPDDIEAGEDEAEGIPFRYASKAVVLDDAYPKSMIELPHPGNSEARPAFRIEVNASEVYAFLVDQVDQLYEEIRKLKALQEKKAKAKKAKEAKAR